MYVLKDGETSQGIHLFVSMILKLESVINQE